MGMNINLHQKEKSSVIFLLSNETSDDEESVGNDNEYDELPALINEGRREAQERALKK